VEKMPFDRNRLPEPMQKRIARKFWEEDAVKGEWRTFGEPVSTSLSDVRYHEVLNGLSQEMADLLLSLPKEKQQRLEPEQRQREEQEWLEVERRKQKARSASPGEIGINDVFIAFKHLDEKGARTRDSKIASNVYEFLTAKGLKVFFSEVTLEDLGISAYKKAIDKALDSATVLVAIGTSRPHLDSEWVRYEWDSFYNDILTGIKPNGSVFTLSMV
jgi:TIR domain